MNFRTTFTIPDSDKKISFADHVVLLGSCFSERIGDKLSYYGFETLVNPFGTLFHPLSIAKLLDVKSSFEPRIVNRNGSWFAYEAHSVVNAKNDQELIIEIQRRKSVLFDALNKSKLLIITFGTSWGHYLNGEIVANCHKMPSGIFTKKLTTLEDMSGVWLNLLQQLKSSFPELDILFTISPVRHIKDGFVENQRSKARLIEFIHALKYPYFPSFEIMLDDLRDYRFYEPDLLHPNSIAVDYIFDFFTRFKIAQNSSQHFSLIKKFRMFENHLIKPFDKDKWDEHQKEVELKRLQILCQIPNLKL